MLALGEYRASRCPCGCGHPARDTLAHENKGPKFTVPPPLRCRARDALLTAQASHAKSIRPEALLWSASKGG